MKDKILYGLVFGFFWLLACLPFWALYLISDLLSFILYRVVGYRRKVVRTNLTNSFPDKSLDEIKKIERKFYHYIADYFVEEIKIMRLSHKQLLKRMSYHNQKLFLDCIEEYGGVVLLIPHYANFEWIIGMGAIMKEGDLPVQIYKPLRNQYFDKLFNYIRSRFGGYNVKKHSTVRELVRLKRDGIKMAVGLIADQNPSSNDARYWTTFLNQDTVFMDGAERIAKMMRFPVLYCDLERIKRGYCKMTFRLVTKEPKATADGEITEAFARHIEETIHREPAFWFWSHKRWKRKREHQDE